MVLLFRTAKNGFHFLIQFLSLIFGFAVDSDILQVRALTLEHDDEDSEEGRSAALAEANISEEECSQRKFLFRGIP